MSLLTKTAFLVPLYIGALLAVSLESTSPTMMMVTSLADASGLVDSEADSGSGDLSERTQPEEVTLLQQPREEKLNNAEHHHQHSVESWKKWTPPDDLLQESRNAVSSSGSSSTFKGSSSQKGHKVRSNCSHYSSSCHDCNRHGCNFMACGRHTVCINGQTYISWKSANRCNRIDKCSAYPKRNSQQISSFSSADSSSYYLPMSNSNGGSLSHENVGGGTKISKSRSNLHSRASNRFRQTSSRNGSSNADNNNNNSNSNINNGHYGHSSRRDDNYAVNYFSRSGLSHNDFSSQHSHSSHDKLTNSASGHEIRPSRSHYSKLSLGSQSVKPGRYVNHQVARTLDASGDYLHSGSASSHRFAAEGDGVGKSRKSRNRAPMPSISIGTVVALMICSSLVVSAVVTVAVKKIHKIYNHNRSLSYGTLQEEH